MQTTTIGNLLSYVGFSERDGAALSGLHERLKPRISGIVDAFYAAIETDDKARAVFADRAQVERLKLSLHSWLNRVLAGPWDDEYSRLRERIGRVHVQVGLPQHYMLTSMSVIRCELHTAVEALASSRAEALACHQALARILDVDLAIMLETYRQDSFDAVRRLQEVERQLLADELTLSEERYRAVLESAEVVAIAVGRSGVVRLFNRQAERLTGRTRTDVLDAADLDRLWHPSDRERIIAAMESTREGVASHVFEARIINRKGESKFVRWHMTALPPSSSGEVCLIGIDLTAERLLAARTTRAEELATLGTLAAGLAHEIRNPLNAAQLQLTVAERRISKGDADKAALQPIGVVRGELDRLAILVNDFLAYARPAPLRLRAIDLASACQAIVELMRPVAEAASVELRAVASEAVPAQCDEEQCRQVLLNLVKNAIDAAALGGGHVEVGVQRVGSSSILTVTDDGLGLPPDLNVFEPFATSKEGGSGLGLSIVKRIAEQHGGTVTAAREAQRTVFRIEFPSQGPSA